MPPEEQGVTLQRMQQSMPTTHGFVMQRIQEMFTEQQMQQEQQAVEAQQQGAPNEKGVGNRKQDQVEVKGEKQKGPTTGNV